MTDVFSQLPPFKWRGKRYPLTERSVSFRHETIEHKLQYRDNDFVEPTGPHSFLFRYGIPMREDIAANPYKNLFRNHLLELVSDVRTKARGALEDPVLGLFFCVPISYEETSDVRKRDGVDVVVEFLHSPEINAGEGVIFQGGLTSLPAITGEAGKLANDVARADWNQQPSPEGMTDVLSAINGLGRQGLRQVDKIASALDDLAFRTKKIEETADLAENPQNWRLRDSARNVRDAATQMQRRLTEDPLKKIARVTVRATKTVFQLASEAGTTVAELIRLNPHLARSPMVKANEVIKVARDTEAEV